jgi:hypothetical protein
VAGLIQNGRGGGGSSPDTNVDPYWDGANGIKTSQTLATLSSKATIAVAQASQVRPNTVSETALWAGNTITGTDTLVMYTYGGDANMDGKINIDDYGRIDFNIPLGTSGWYNGDFNYDGKINIDDYGIIDFNLPIQGPQIFTAGGVGGGAAASGGASALSVTAVPEPASISLIGLGAASLLGRRSRRRRSK